MFIKDFVVFRPKRFYSLLKQLCCYKMVETDLKYITLCGPAILRPIATLECLDLLFLFLSFDSNGEPLQLTTYYLVSVAQETWKILNIEISKLFVLVDRLEAKALLNYL